MKEVNNLSESHTSDSCDKSQTFQEVALHNLLKQHQDSDGVCTVILDPSDVSFIPILPVEASEEIVYYETEQDDDIKLEIDVSTDNYQDVYHEVYPQPNKRSSGKKSRLKCLRPEPHVCKFCKKAFSQVVNLVTHERIHTGEKPFLCVVCTKAFSQQPNLWKHMRTHTGERPYQCMHCKKKFTQQANLTKHIRVHTGERPYRCEHCEKCFTQQANLTKHVRLHTGERPYHCHYCTKTFVQQSNLERHLRTHTGIKPFKCQICGICFAQNAHLAKHSRSMHKNVLEHDKGEEDSVYIKIKEIEIESESHSETTLMTAESHSKKFGIPVLYCTKTGKILKRVN